MPRISVSLGTTLALALASVSVAQTTIRTGSSSSADPYVRPVAGSPVRDIVSILTVGDTASGFTMVGIPDGLGAFPNGDGTFTLLMNHEFTAAAGGIHYAFQPDGFAGGAFVSKWVIDASTLATTSGSEAIASVMTLSNGSGGSLYNFSRFCSADLAKQAAYFNPTTGNGTTEHIYLHGEENYSAGNPGRLMATVVSTGVSYQLPAFDPLLGGWENALSRPYASDKTVTIATSDGGANRVFVYVGDKQSTGTAVERAGLMNGSGWGIQVQVNGVNVSNEDRTFGFATSGRPVFSGTFTFGPAGQPAGTTFLRPEDGAWDPAHPSDFYFVTTDRLNTPSQVGRSRLWHLHFSDVENVLAGGTIQALLDGTEGYNMLDNMCVVNTIQGGTKILMQEDPGNASWNAKTYMYDVATDTLTTLLQSDPARFGDLSTPATAPFTQDEENSGIIDASDVLGAGWFIADMQAHYALPNPLVEGGQLYAFFVPEAIGSCASDFNLDGITDAADLAILLGAWGSTGLTDLNADGTTDAADLAVLLGAWGPCAG
ncbi:MAG: hypothetical protein U0572_15475 [Phycisphaerales bacterium]